MMEQKHSGRKHIFYVAMVLTASVIFGISFVVARSVIDAGYSPVFINLVRFTVSALLLGIIFWRDLRRLDARTVKRGILAGVSICAGSLLQSMGLEKTTPANSAFITATSIILVPFFTWVLFRQRPPIRLFAAALACFSGVVVLTWEPQSLRLVFGQGEALTLLCAVCFAIHTVYVGYIARDGNPRTLSFLQLTTAAVLCGVIFLIGDRNFEQFRPAPAYWGLFYLAVFATCIASYLFVHAQKHIPPPQVAVIASTESLIAALTSVLVGYELLSTPLVIGGLLVMVSVFAAVVQPAIKHSEIARN